jgi:hypothetical protein
LKGKLDQLPIDIMVAVSRSGFFKPAIRLAKRFKIHTYTYEQVGEPKVWAQIVGKKKILAVYSKIKPILKSLTVTIFYPDDETKPDLTDVIPDKTMLYKNTGESDGTLKEIAQRVVDSEGFRTIIFEKLERDLLDSLEDNISKAIELGITFKPASGSYIISEGRKRPIISINVKGIVRGQKKITQIEAGSYADAAVAHAKSESFGNKVDFVLIEKAEEPIKVSVEIKPISNN